MATNIKGIAISDSYDRLVLVQDGNDIGAGTDTMNIEIQTQAGVATATPLYISTNRVGIGTATPDFTLDVAAGGIGILEGSAVSWHNSSGSISGQIYATSGDIMHFRNTSSETTRMTILADGKVGIGTTSPGVLLEVSKSIKETTLGTSSALDVIGTSISSRDTTTIQDMFRLHQPNTEATSKGSTFGIGLGFWQNPGDNYPRTIVHFKTTGRTTDTAVAGYTVMTLRDDGDVAVTGELTAGTKTFKIDHPLPAMKEKHHLIHSCVEAPRADLIYRGKVDLVSGSATINIDTEAGMTAGTFVLLCDDVQCFTTNESNWDKVKGSVSGDVLTIESDNPDSTASISWMVIGDRKDEKIKNATSTDENGKFILEPLKENNS